MYTWFNFNSHFYARSDKTRRQIKDFIVANFGSYDADIIQGVTITNSPPGLLVRIEVASDLIYAHTVSLESGWIDFARHYADFAHGPIAVESRYDDFDEPVHHWQIGTEKQLVTTALAEVDEKIAELSRMRHALVERCTTADDEAIVSTRNGNNAPYE